MPVDSLRPSASNPRKRLSQSDPGRFNALKKSLARGVFAPILVEEGTNEVLGGHQRLEAARELGMDTLPVVFLSGLTPADKTRIMIADNGGWGSWDFPTLREQVLTLPSDDLSLLGLTDWELDTLALEPPPLPEDIPEPPPDKEEFTTFKVPRMPKPAADRAHAILARFCERHGTKEAAALAFILEQYDQNPDLAETA